MTKTKNYISIALLGVIFFVLSNNTAKAESDIFNTTIEGGIITENDYVYNDFKDYYSGRYIYNDEDIIDRSLIVFDTSNIGSQNIFEAKLYFNVFDDYFALGNLQTWSANFDIPIVMSSFYDTVSYLGEIPSTSLGDYVLSIPVNTINKNDFSKFIIKTEETTNYFAVGFNVYLELTYGEEKQSPAKIVLSSVIDPAIGGSVNMAKYTINNYFWIILLFIIIFYLFIKIKKFNSQVLERQQEINKLDKYIKKGKKISKMSKKQQKKYESK
jgi:hypothetical protein